MSVIMKIIYFGLVLSVVLSPVVNGAKILAVFQVPTKSHHIIGSTLMKGLATKGHQITMFSPFPEKTKIPNYRDVFLHNMHEISDRFRDLLSSSHKSNTLEMLTLAFNFTNQVTETTLRNPGIDAILHSYQEFDLIVTDAFNNDAFFGFAHRFKAPIIFVATGSSSAVNHLTANISPAAFVPNAFFAYNDTMTFIERTLNTAAALTVGLVKNTVMDPVQKKLYEEFFPDAPPFEEAIKNVSLTLINSNIVFETPRPLMPNMIPIGGMHITDPKPLPKDLQKIMDEADNGVIFFSLGSYLNSAKLEVAKINAIMKTFAKLPQRIIWKYEDENLPGKPENLIIGKWFPQSDILAHPNIKLFITHGGLLSSTEATYRGVPVLGIPFYGDQHGNTATFVSAGLGQKIQFADITEETFLSKIQEVINNPKYRETMKRNAAILQDQPMKPLEKAIYWCEYVIRHKGARHLRSKAVDLTFIEYFLIDVLAFVTVVFSTFIIGLYLVINRLFCTSSKKEIKPKKKAKRA